MCDLPCDTGGPKFNKLSDIETEVLKYRFGFNIVNLCHEHYLGAKKILSGHGDQNSEKHPKNHLGVKK